MLRSYLLIGVCAFLANACGKDGGSDDDSSAVDVCGIFSDQEVADAIGELKAEAEKSNIEHGVSCYYNGKLDNLRIESLTYQSETAATEAYDERKSSDQDFASQGFAALEEPFDPAFAGKSYFYHHTTLPWNNIVEFLLGTKRARIVYGPKSGEVGVTVDQTKRSEAAKAMARKVQAAVFD